MSLIARGPIGCWYLASAEITHSASIGLPRPQNSLRPASGQPAQAAWMVPGVSRAGERAGSELPRRSRARPTQHRSGEHLQAGSSSWAAALRVAELHHSRIARSNLRVSRLSLRAEFALGHERIGSREDISPASGDRLPCSSSSSATAASADRPLLLQTDFQRSS